MDLVTVNDDLLCLVVVAICWVYLQFDVFGPLNNFVYCGLEVFDGLLVGVCGTDYRVSTAFVRNWVYRKLLGMSAVKGLHGFGDNTASCGTTALMYLVLDDLLKCLPLNVQF